MILLEVLVYPGPTHTSSKGKIQLHWQAMGEPAPYFFTSMMSEASY
jgi:hypothetical protein